MINLTGDLFLIGYLSELIKAISEVIMMGVNKPPELVGIIATVEVNLMEFKKKFNLVEKVNKRIKELLE